MKRFIQGEHRGQSALLPESLDDYVARKRGRIYLEAQPPDSGRQLPYAMTADWESWEK